jgi:hypothetical protein
MEYVTYILIILGIMALCIVLFRRKDNLNGAYRGSDSFSVSSKPDSPARLAEAKASSNERLKVPTPWGWPGNDLRTRATHEHSVSDTVQRFVDHLMVEKQTVEDRNYVQQRNESLRKLVEDRYGPSSNNANGYGKSESKKEPTDLAGSPIVVDRNSLHEVRTPWGW